MARRREEDDAGFEFENCEVKRETELAVLILANDPDFDKDDAGRWVPKSCLHDNSEIWKTGDKGRVVIKGWFAKKEGLL